MALVVGALAVPVPATAASVNECGDGAILYGGHAQIVNVTSRIVGCATARRFARAFEVQGCYDNRSCGCAEDRYCSFRRYRCRNVAGRRSIDHRCTRGARVIRWQTEYYD
jgi:hypothetical protein